MPNEQATGKTAEGGDDDEDEKTPIPPTVEDITRHEDEQVLPPQLLENKPVE